jgi:hypothetical protein
MAYTGWVVIPACISNTAFHLLELDGAPRSDALCCRDIRPITSDHFMAMEHGRLSLRARKSGNALANEGSLRSLKDDRAKHTTLFVVAIRYRLATLS